MKHHYFETTYMKITFKKQSHEDQARRHHGRMDFNSTLAWLVASLKWQDLNMKDSKAFKICFQSKLGWPINWQEITTCKKF